MLAFAVGCMSLETPEDDSLLEDEWCARIESALRALASVSKVSVAAGSLDRSGYQDYEEDFFTFPSGAPYGSFRPQPRTGFLEFTVDIPQHLQDSLSPFGVSRSGSERFFVRTHYNAWAPVTFVIPVGAGV